jgi:alcohol dehydrogenase
MSDAPTGFDSFDHQPRTRLVFGVGAVERTGELAHAIGLKKILLVTDRGVVAAGHAARAQHALQQAGVAVVLFDAVTENPTTRDVDLCLAAARAAEIDGIIGLGGGSSLDTAKGCNFLLTNGGRMQDYWGVGKAAQPMLPFIAIPTTAGTGSECQSFALIADEKTHQKMACGDPKAAARVAILDPALTVSQPPHVTACTGVDALSHALESAVTRKRNAISTAFAREAFRLCAESLPRVLRAGDDLTARGGMLMGAALGGLAIENSMLGAAHAAANPLTAHYGIAHGRAIGVMLGPVIQFNSADPAIRQIYDDLAPGRSLPAELARLLEWARMPKSLAECGVEKSALPALAAEAARQWTATVNPRRAGEAEFRQLYEAAFAPAGETAVKSF